MPSSSLRSPCSSPVLVTGASGFLGSHVVLGLLLRTQSPVICLGRSNSATDLRDRVARALETAAVAYANPPEVAPLLDRVEAIEVDLSAPQMGLDSDVIEALHARGCADFWHFAASLKFEEDNRDEIMRINVDGTRAALDLAKAIGAERFVYVSTAFVNGSQTGEIGNVVNSTGVFNNVYEESKQAAEFAVIESDLKHMILRPSIIIGNTETSSPAGARTGFYRLVRELSRVSALAEKQNTRVRVGVDSHAEMNLVPVDHFVRDCMDIAVDGLTDGQTIFNLTATRAYTLAELEVFMPDVRINSVDLVDVLHEPTPLETVLDKRTGFFRKYLQNGDLKFLRTPVEPSFVGVDQLRRFSQRALNIDETDNPKGTLVVATQEHPSIAVRELNSGKSENVVIVNAYGLPDAFWTPVTDRLMRDYNVHMVEFVLIASVEPDRSELLRDARSIARYVNSLQRRSHVVSWCSGSGVALAAATMIEDCGGCVHFGGGFILGDRNFERTDYARITRDLYARAAQSKEVARVIYESMFRKLANTSDPEAAQQMNQISFVISCMDPQYLEWATNMFRSFEDFYSFALKLNSLNNYEIDAFLSDTKVPTLLLIGADDQNVDARVSRLVADRIAKGQYKELKGADHWGLHSDARVGDEIHDFLQECA